LRCLAKCGLHDCSAAVVARCHRGFSASGAQNVIGMDGISGRGVT
jgi:hypothetical protein